MSQCKRCAIDEELSKGYCSGCWSEISGYRQALQDVRCEIEALVDAPDAMVRVDGRLIGYLSIAHVVALLEKLEQKAGS